MIASHRNEECIMLKRQIPLLALALLTAASALAQQAMAQNSMQGMSTYVESPADKAMMAGMKKMQNEMMAAPVSGNTDKDFVAMMIPHHEGAIEMAQVELQYGKDPELRKMATAIITAQNKEIAEMTKWQAGHGAR
jgi:uncharacterized protein (DUF305 family)